MTPTSSWAPRIDAVLFDNIAESEARHQETVAGLLAKHGIANPTAGDALGVFDDPAVQTRYNDLIARARTSLTSALEVGVVIEESEIRILTGILATTDPQGRPAGGHEPSRR